MDIQKEIEISKYQPVVFCKDTELGNLYEVMVQRWNLEKPGRNAFASSLFYNLGRVHGIREERARRKRGR